MWHLKCYCMELNISQLALKKNVYSWHENLRNVLPFAMWAERNSNSKCSILNPLPPAFQRAQKLNPAKLPCQNDLKGGKKVARGLEGNSYSRSKKKKKKNFKWSSLVAYVETYNSSDCCFSKRLNFKKRKQQQTGCQFTQQCHNWQEICSK